MSRDLPGSGPYYSSGNRSPGRMDQRWIYESASTCIKCLDKMVKRAPSLEQRVNRGKVCS